MRQFSPICTLPETGPAFISAPNVRSTFDIVWTCVTVLILCSWSVLHLTVPEQYTPKTRRQRFNLQAARLGIKVKWMLITLIGPEFIFGSAAAAWYAARRNTPDLQQVAEEDGVPWSRAHTSFADIGGFVLRFHNDDGLVAPGTPDFTSDSGHGYGMEFEDILSLQDDQKLKDKRKKIRAKLEARARRYGTSPWRPHKTHETHSAEAIKLAASRSRRQVDESLLLLEGDMWILTACQLYKARISGIIPTLPHVTQEDLDDKNKGDVLVKLLAVAQVSWMVFQVILRATMSRPSSPLEIMAMAFAVSTFLFYLLSMDRPQNINTPIYIYAQRPASTDEMAMIAVDSSTVGRLRVETDHTPDFTTGSRSGPILLTFSNEMVYLITVALGSLVFGGMHLFAWNSPFPTDIEKWLWRTSSLLTMLAPITALGISIITMGIGRMIPFSAVTEIGLWTSMLFVGMVCLAMVIARLFITVEVFRSLYYLPPENYVNTWAANIPHFG